MDSAPNLVMTSVRTIYRDIQALSEAGVPVVAVPGQGYSLMEGYFLPLLTFSADEAAMLLLGSEVMAGSFDAQFRSAAESAGRKIAAVLPERLRDDVALLRQSIVFIAGRRGPGGEDLSSLRRAILDRSTVRFTYHTRHRADGSASPATREVDPYALAHMEGAWYLTGYDHLRTSVRTFRLSRMENLDVLEQRFTRPKNLPRGGREGDPRSIGVRVLFRPEAARWVRENPSLPEYLAVDHNHPFSCAMRAASTRFLASSFWMASER
jgi:predicted DNA-binding transcriptional regulator YafY